MGHKRWAAMLGRDELSSALALGAGLVGAAALNFAFIGAMGRLLEVTPEEIGISVFPHPTVSEALREAILKVVQESDRVA